MNSKIFIPDFFLTQHLERPTYQLSLIQKPLELKPSLSSLPKNAFCFYKSPIEEHAQGFKNSGFLLAETSLKLQNPLNKKISSTLTFSCRKALLTDKENAMKLAFTAFSHSRFHQDPNFSHQIANKVKMAWVENYFLGKRGDGLIVSTTHQTLTGFLLWIKKEDTVVIDLIAVDKRFRSQGIGTEMLLYLEKISTAKKMLVGTQSTNLESISFYTRNGFTLDHSEFTYHWHNSQRA